METLDKKKVLAVVLVIALIAALVGAVSLLYNSIDMFCNTTLFDWKSPKYVLSGSFNQLQKPLAIISLVAAFVAFLGVAVGVSSFIVKKPVFKIVLLIVCIVAVLAFIAFMIAASCLWTDYYNGKNSDYVFPNHIKTNDHINEVFVIYSGVMAMLIPELVYFALIATVLLTVYLIDKKAAKVTAVEANDINSENKGDQL